MLELPCPPGIADDDGGLAIFKRMNSERLAIIKRMNSVMLINRGADKISAKSLHPFNNEPAVKSRYSFT